MAHNHPTMDEPTMATSLMTTTTSMNHDHGDHGSIATTMTMGHNHGSMDHGTMDHGTMDHGSMDHGSMDHSSMSMYFHDGYHEYVLFKPCYTETVGAMVGACFAIFALAVLYEGLKFLREYHLQRTYPGRALGAYSVDGFRAGASQEQITTVVIVPSVMSRIFSSSHFVQTFLHMVQVFISYCLMLVFMTYNVWLCLSVIVGAGVGYFIFGWKRAVVVDTNEHCH